KTLNPFIDDVFYEIFSFITLNVKFILNCRLVCKEWNYMIMNNSNLWNNVEVYVPNLHKVPAQLKLVLTRIKCNPLITDKDLEQISYFKKVQQLNLYFCNEITDYGLQHLMTLSSLQGLDLSFCSIADNELK